MKVRITKGNGWYDGQEGTVHDVIRTMVNRQSKTEFIVWEGKDGDYNWIDEDDCEVIN